MEQKRLLWIIAAVGVFLLVVLGAALIIYAPAAKTPQTLTSTQKTNNKNTASGWISLAPAGQEQDLVSNEIQPASKELETPAEIKSGFDFETPVQTEDLKVKEITIRADNATVYNGVPEGKTAQTAQTIINNTTTIDLSTPVPPAEITGTPAPRREPRPETRVKPKKEAPVSYNTSVATKPAAKKVEKTPSVVVNNKTVVKSTPKKAVVTKYWVQVTSLTSRKSADAAREVLGKNQINADVFTYNDNKNQLYYRVRVGPYTTKTEAEYWRTKINQIDTFRNTASYVTSTTSELE